MKWVWLLIPALLSACDGVSNDPVPFVDAAQIDFVHKNGARGAFAMPEITSAGAALLDFDSDGDLDVLAIQSESSTTELAAYGGRTLHRLFENRLVPDGSLAFIEVSATARITTDGYGMGVATGDTDNDGDPDIYVTANGQNSLYRNDGDGAFTDITARAGVDEPRWSASAAFCDLDRDGMLDLFVTNYVYFAPTTEKRCNDAAGREDYCSPDVYRPVPDTLFINQGEGRFEDRSTQWGIDRAFGPGLGVLCADFDLDGFVDVYVANDGQANQLWMSGSGKRFDDQAMASGTALNISGSAEASMGVTSGDFDGDGDEDLFMTHLDSETNTIYRNDGAAGFFDVTDQVQLGSKSIAFTGFGTGWFDFENDGDLDLFIANGAVKRQLVSNPTVQSEYGQRNQLFVNNNGRFTEQSALLGEDFRRLEVSRGAAFGDIDNDGDVDVVIANNGGPLRVLRNQAPLSNHWLRLKLRGTDSNADAIGARVAIMDRKNNTLWRRVYRDGSYLSANDVRVHAGLGRSDAPVSVGVIWPNGLREKFDGIAVDQQHTLTEGSGADWPDR